MKRKKRGKTIGFIVGGLLLVTAVWAYAVTYTGTNIYPNQHKKHAMIRLEDVGPGGDYDSPEALGKLRAVMEYIEHERIPFQVAVIPRSISLGSDGIWRERGIDDPDPDPFVSGFIGLLQEAQQQGGVLGMHGYTHQYGAIARPDSYQNSGIGPEFKVSGAPETKEPAFAAARITDSLAAFQRAGLQPAFWESPHYKDTRRQEETFRSFLGILYQPDLHSLRSFKDLNMYDTTNAYGQSSLGSVYVPTPFSYIRDGKSVDKILSKAKRDDGLASFFYHPFLEFPYLEPVLEQDGKPVEREGFPVYRYKAEGDISYLHRLLQGLRQENYRWVSLHDIVPFTPAHRVMLPQAISAQQVLLGDVTGAGHADVVVREAHRISVIPGSYDWPRNRAQQATEVWLKESFAPEEQLLLIDINGDGKEDLLVYDRQTGKVRACLAGERQFQPPVPSDTLPVGLESLQTVRSATGSRLIALGSSGIVDIRAENNRLAWEEIKAAIPMDSTLHSGSFLNPARDDDLIVSQQGADSIALLQGQAAGGYLNLLPIEGVPMTADDQLRVGDPNGDGLSDLILYAAKSGVWRIYENEGNGKFHPLDNDFGPWAQGKGRIGFVADFDGNGKTDIASYDGKAHTLDISLSFRGRMPSL